MDEFKKFRYKGDTVLLEQVYRMKEKGTTESTISEKLGISTGAVRHKVKVLQRAGFLEKGTRKSRATILDKPYKHTRMKAEVAKGFATPMFPDPEEIATIINLRNEGHTARHIAEDALNNRVTTQQVTSFITNLINKNVLEPKRKLSGNEEGVHVHKNNTEKPSKNFSEGEAVETRISNMLEDLPLDGIEKALSSERSLGVKGSLSLEDKQLVIRILYRTLCV